MIQCDLEWPKIGMDMVYMTHYDFRWVKSIAVAPFCGPSDLDITTYSDSVTSQRETTILWYVVKKCQKHVYVICEGSLHHAPKFNNFLWVFSFLGKNPYYHMACPLFYPHRDCSAECQCVWNFWPSTIISTNHKTALYFQLICHFVIGWFPITASQRSKVNIYL